MIAGTTNIPTLLGSAQPIAMTGMHKQVIRLAVYLSGWSEQSWAVFGVVGQFSLSPKMPGAAIGEGLGLWLGSGVAEAREQQVVETI